MTGLARIAATSLFCMCIGLVSAVAQQSPDWAHIISFYKNAAVLLRIETPGRPPAYGSGLIATKDGIVLTARHVLPAQDVIDRKEFLITGLVGWDKLPIDFDSAKGLQVRYISTYRDLAVLQIAGLPTDLNLPCASDKIQQGEPALLLAYPGGGALTATAGITAGPAPDDLYRYDAPSGVGESGGPVFATNGSVLGLHLEGTRRRDDGNIELAYLLGMGPILKDLQAQQQGFGPPLCAQGHQENVLSAALLPEINFAYQVSETKSDHDGVIASRQAYSRVFSAQQGYRIVSAQFVAQSIAHASAAPEVSIVKEGEQVAINFVLESGPVFDQWRGWVTGVLNTRQQAKR